MCRKVPVGNPTPKMVHFEVLKMSGSLESVPIGCHVGLCSIPSISGWWLTYPSEKYERQWEDDYPIYYGQIKNV
jgi:hypothetical protein